MLRFLSSKQRNSQAIFEGLREKQVRSNFRQNSKSRIFLGIRRWSKIETEQLWPACMFENSVRQEVHGRLNQMFFKSWKANTFTFFNVQQLLNKFSGHCFFVTVPLM